MNPTSSPSASGLRARGGRRRITALSSAAIAAVAVGALAWILSSGLPGQQAQAQGVMSAPACQCSAPTTVPGVGARITHCLCGAMSCAISVADSSGDTGTTALPRNVPPPLMQCVRS